MKETHYRQNHGGIDLLHVGVCPECGFKRIETVNHLFGSLTETRKAKLEARGLQPLPHSAEDEDACDGDCA